MIKYRNNLPQLTDGIFLTDSGLETTLIYLENLELPEFTAFPLLEDERGFRAMRDYFRRHAALAKEAGVGFVLESVTWRANSDWGRRLGYSDDRLAEMNRRSIEMLEDIRREFETDRTKIVISGCVGPRGDRYVPSEKMSAREARDYHSAQIRTFSETAADMVAAFTINYVEEAIGITEAAKSHGMPVAISFTVETDGKLPTGQTLKDATEAVDAATGNAPAYFMINCAHPTHFENVLADEPWANRIRGIRANASTKSHAELNDSTELDAGDPAELGEQYRGLLDKFKNLKVLGGCCGTDFRHIEAICRASVVRA
jgi:S-methylmethionine-dependent homocysteine/selenocysteine methylase